MTPQRPSSRLLDDRFQPGGRYWQPPGFFCCDALPLAAGRESCFFSCHFPRSDLHLLGKKRIAGRVLGDPYHHPSVQGVPAMFRAIRRYGVFVLGAVMSLGLQAAHAGCPYSAQQIQLIKQQMAVYQQYADYYCRYSSYGSQYAQACQTLRSAISQYQAILQQCNNNPPQPPTDNCDALRQQIRTNAENGRQVGLSALNRIPLGYYKFYYVQYQLLATTHCGQSLMYYSAKTVRFSSANEAIRTVNQVANNGGRVLSAWGSRY
jgi:hypothetical protein